MVPGRYDITIYRGSTWSIAVEAANAQGVSLDFAVNYDQMRMQIRPAWKQGAIPAGEPLLSLTTANGRLAVSESGTQILLTISAADTASLAFNAGQYELELVKDPVADPPAIEVVDKILYGSVQVTGEITI